MDDDLMMEAIAHDSNEFEEADAPILLQVPVFSPSTRSVLKNVVYNTQVKSHDAVPVSFPTAIPTTSPTMAPTVLPTVHPTPLDPALRPLFKSPFKTGQVWYCVFS